MIAATTLLGERIYLARRRKGFDQVEMAAAMSDVLGKVISRQLISKWERGRGVPNAIELACIAQVTDYPLDELYEATVIDLTHPDQAGDGIHSSLGMVYQPSLPFDADDPATGDLIGAAMGLEAHYAAIDLRDERVTHSALAHAAA